MAPRTLVVHATHLLRRGFLVVSTDRHNDAGMPTNALYALTHALRRALAFKTPDYAVAVVEPEPVTDAITGELRTLAGPELYRRNAFRISGLTATVASMGTALTEPQLRELRRLTSQIYRPASRGISPSKTSDPAHKKLIGRLLPLVS